MKITQDVRSQLETTQKQPLHTSNQSDKFSSLMGSHAEKLKEQELQKLLKDLTAQGEKIARFRSFRDLARYKRMVKGFIEESVQYGMDLKHSRSWTMEGNNRKLTTVEEVDKKLMELTEVVMDQEKKSIGILGLIGEIEGLLINLYR
ncbi:YaaR family protein [Aquibacillus sediminis]|uniref:YaaR family protein n=1 Tax=Aquibacillus sediminis TaxID=2574734 RepID=UPI001108C5D9|nr:YaaR family protein [Aquibacillus sediminis]